MDDMFERSKPAGATLPIQTGSPGTSEVLPPARPSKPSEERSEGLQAIRSVSASVSGPNLQDLTTAPASRPMEGSKQQSGRQPTNQSLTPIGQTSGNRQTPEQPAAAITTAAPGQSIMSGIAVHPDMPTADVQELARRLGRPKANAAAEALIKQWFRVIDDFVETGTKFDTIFDVMMHGPDHKAFKEEFTKDADGKTKVDIRKFRRLVGDRRKLQQ